ncbi:MAG: NAD-dependent epimerase/dehydratase family protein [Bacteroidales bacterium]|nr:NAD-dependent epimerase/dehydratase family protein [Bacteroidales bacterium]MBN2632437.1 NAD-dependent epimerase/dehydratase family protein [Bacteroidales bacterium]
MNVLLTGADGLFGSNLVRMLLLRGYSVRVLLYNKSASTTINDLDVERYPGDVLVPSTIDNAISGCDAVIHAAASTSIWPARSEFVRKVNIEGTRNVIDSVLKNKINRMVYIGSGSSVNSADESEGNQTFPGARFGLDYIDSKFEALNLVLEAVKNKGLPALAILPTFMIGPYDSQPSSGKMILQVARGRMKFYSGGGRNFVYVNDVAVAVTNSLTEGTIGKYYIAGNENITYREFLTKAADILKKPRPAIAVPDWLIKTIGMLGSFYGKILHREPLLTYNMACISCEKQYVNSDDAVKELKMPRTNIETAIRECYEWFIDNKYL